MGRPEDPRGGFKIPGTENRNSRAPILDAMEEGGGLEALKFVSEKSIDGRGGCCGEKEKSFRSDKAASRKKGKPA